MRCQDGLLVGRLTGSQSFQVALGDALVADPELLDHPAAAGVAGHDADLDAVQQQLLERELQHHHHGLGDVGVAGMALLWAVGLSPTSQLIVVALAALAPSG